MKKLIFIFSFLLLLTLSACNNDVEDQNIIYTTVYPVSYLVEEIAGEEVIVKRVPGSQNHSESIDWTPKEIIDMINSDIIFYVDAGVDTYIPSNANGVFQDANARLLNLSDAITYNQICVTDDHSHEEDDEHEEVEEEHLDEGVLETCESSKIIEDPHFWLDPVRMLEAAGYIKDQLILEYPEEKALFESNYEALKIKLEQLHLDYEEMALEVTKPIITTSLLFSYYEDRYDIEIIAMATTPHSGENIPSDIIEITAEAVFHDIHYVIYEKNVNSPAADALFTELSKVESYEVKKGYLHGLGSLITEEVDAGFDYISIMRDNLETLSKATK